MSDYKIYFSDFFNVSHEKVSKYGALDISLLCDNPAFVDPFLIFYSKKEEYIELHERIILYMSYLRKKSTNGQFSLYDFKFPEVKQVWLGFSKNGNNGQGLGKHFANELDRNLSSIFRSSETGISDAPHLEKLCLVGDRVGADKISDFTLNLIKSFLVSYTETFAAEYIDNPLLKEFGVPHSEFDFEKGLWIEKRAKLPAIKNEKGLWDYVLLVPKDILVKEDGWISKNDYLNQESSIINRIEDKDLREKVNRFFMSQVPQKRTKNGEWIQDSTKVNKREALRKTTLKFPELLDYYIREKELNGDSAVKNSVSETNLIESILYSAVKKVIDEMSNDGFLSEVNSHKETKKNLQVFKNYLENRGGWKLFWEKNQRKEKIKESDFQILIDLVFSHSQFSVDREVNNGPGPVDHKVSMGKKDVTLIEVKLAKNSQLRKNLLNQLDTYLKTEEVKNGFYVIIFFDDTELAKVNRVLNELDMQKYVDDKMFLIDCRYKKSASKI